MDIHYHQVETSPVRLYCLDSGGSHAPLVCLHGKYGRGSTFAPLIGHYGNRYRIIAPDQRGHGLSDKPENGYAGEDFVADTLALLDALELASVVMLGHSIGGRNAAWFAAMHPERVKALVVVDARTSGPSQASAVGRDSFLDQFATPYATLAQARADLARSSRLGTRNNVDYFMASLAGSVAGYDFMFSHRAMAAIGAQYVGWADLWQRISCPVLLMRASNSWYLGAEEAARMCTLQPSCAYVEIGGSDHLIHADNPARFYQALDAFLSTCSCRGR